MSITSFPSASIFDQAPKAVYPIGSPEIYTSPEVILPLDLDAQINKVQRWLSGEHNQELCLHNISLEDLEHVKTRFCEEGLKLRYDWFAVTRTASLRMPSLMHELPGGWLSQQVERLNKTLASVARCGRPHLSTGISGNVTLPDGSSLQPDQQLLLTLHFEKDQSLGIPRPRVMLETAFSQPLEKAIAKAWQYLHLLDRDTHAVIICDLSSPITTEHNFKAEMFVWVREKTGDIDEEFPLEKSNEIDHEPTHSPLESEGDADVVETESSQGSSWGSSTLVSDWPMQVGHPSTWRFYQPTGQTKRIWRRSETPVVIYDEAQQERKRKETKDGLGMKEDQENNPRLLLEVYDFLRLCPQHPDLFLPEAEIPLPLALLCEEMVVRLQIARDELQSPLQVPSQHGHSPRPSIARRFPPNRRAELEGQPTKRRKLR